jgi:molybdopterin-guanine dinucleotide biosynthesis protein A
MAEPSSEGRWPHTGAILAGGRGRRMGAPKHDVRLPAGRRMIEAVADALWSTCRHVVVVGPPEAMPALPHVEDLRPGLGPLGGIEALLASGIDAQYLVCPCDQPSLTAALLRTLLEPSLAPVTALRLQGEARPRPLPLRVSVEALDVVRAHLDAGRHAVRELLESVDTETIDLPRSREGQLLNVNRPEDLAGLEP